MKYIRTANGIYTSTLDSVLANMRPRLKDIYLRHKNGESFEDIAKDYGLSPWTIRNYYNTARNHVKFRGQRLLENTGKVIKEADTIEELCDEIIVMDEKGRYFFVSDKGAKDHEMYKKFYVYGAIWTGKGLIYVAKMNDNGEVELL